MKRQRNAKVAAPVAANDKKGGPKVEGTQEDVGADQETTAVVVTNRKARKQAEKEVVAVEEERGGGEESCTAAEAVESMMQMEGWRWMGGGGVDEQMSWGYISVPDWDLEELKGKAHSDLYNDDYWDDDLWGLKAIKEIPNE